MTMLDECLPGEIGITLIDIYDSICEAIILTDTFPFINELAVQALITDEATPTGTPFFLKTYTQWCETFITTADTSYIWFKIMGSEFDPCYGPQGTAFDALIQIRLDRREYLP